MPSIVLSFGGWHQAVAQPHQLNRVLLKLQYWRKYGTYFHTGQVWETDESTADRIVPNQEDTPIQLGANCLLRRFAKAFPGKKCLQHLNS